MSEPRNEKPTDRMEIRYHGNELDEVVARDAFVHIEKMDDGRWWIGIDVDDRHYAINLGVVNRRAKTYAFIEDQG